MAISNSDGSLTARGRHFLAPLRDTRFGRSTIFQVLQKSAPDVLDLAASPIWQPDAKFSTSLTRRARSMLAISSELSCCIPSQSSNPLPGSPLLRCYHLPVDRCEVVEVRSLDDIEGYACSKLATASCGDCGRAICAAHSGRCESCGDTFCLGCLAFHPAEDRKPKGSNAGMSPVTADRRPRKRKSA
jgi:hypothetical protein